MKLTCGVRFTEDVRFQAFGVDEVNTAIQKGHRVTKIQPSIYCKKIGGVEDGMQQLAYVGCNVIVTFDDAIVSERDGRSASG